MSFKNTVILHNYLVIYLFIFLLRWVFIAVHGLSVVVVNGVHSSLWCAGFSLWWLLSLWSTGSRRMGFSSCGTQQTSLLKKFLLWAREPPRSDSLPDSLVSCAPYAVM